MHRSHLTHQEWAIGLYLYTANIKGVSSMRLHRELGISKKSAWFLMHRLRTASETGEELFSGPVEADEKLCGGWCKKLSNSKRKELQEASVGRGTFGKTAVAGMKDRETNKVMANVVEKTDVVTSRGFVEGHTEEGAQVYTDEGAAYMGINRPHEAVKHSVSKYVRGMAHTNGLESFWSMMEREHDGIYHMISPKHLKKYVTDSAMRHNIRDKDTIDQMGEIVRGMVGKRLKFAGRIYDNGLLSDSRS